MNVTINRTQIHPNQTLIWTVGAGGLLGSALQRAFNSDSSIEAFPASAIDWTDPDRAQETFLADAPLFAELAGGRPWVVIWAAGHASTSTPQGEAFKELDALQLIVNAVKQYPPSGTGTFFVTSSAGGIYAGSENPPFTSDSSPHPLSPYGELKLRQEELVSQQLGERTRVIIGRLSNLYGPGQNLGKLQGLISQLVVSSITKVPLKMFVSLDTLRDYIYTDDAAQIILSLVMGPNWKPGVDTQVIASGQPVSLGYLIHLAEDIARARIPIAVGAHASSAAQARDLRLIPSHNGASSQIHTTLPAGIKNVYLDILGRRQRA